MCRGENIRISKTLNETNLIFITSASSVSGREKWPTWRPLVTCGRVWGIEEDGVFAQFLAKGKTKKKKIGPVFFCLQMR